MTTMMSVQFKSGSDSATSTLDSTVAPKSELTKNCSDKNLTPSNSEAATEEHTEVWGEAVTETNPISSGDKASDVDVDADPSISGCVTSEEANEAGVIFNQGNTIEVNGIRYVKAWESIDSADGLMINDIWYVLEELHGRHKTVGRIMSDVSFTREMEGDYRSSEALSQYHGRPVTVYVGPSQSRYSVHLSILSKSRILSSMPLDEDTDEGGSYSITLPDEDPILFERLLAYLYRGALGPAVTELGQVYCFACGELCICWNTHALMRLYTLACAYQVDGLADEISSKLSLKDDAVAFAEVFKGAYERCPGNQALRYVFKSKFVSVYENELQSWSSWGGWGTGFNAKKIELLSELASCGGEFAVDLTQSLAIAHEQVLVSNAEKACDGGYHNHDDEAPSPSGWGGNASGPGPAVANWDGNAVHDDDAGHGWNNVDAKCDDGWGCASSRATQTAEWPGETRCEGWKVETIGEPPASLAQKVDAIQESMKSNQSVVRELEHMVAAIVFKLDAMLQPQTQPTNSANPEVLHGKTHGRMPPSWVQPTESKRTMPQAGSGSPVAVETKCPVPPKANTTPRRELFPADKTAATLSW